MNKKLILIIIIFTLSILRPANSINFNLNKQVKYTGISLAGLAIMAYLSNQIINISDETSKKAFAETIYATVLERFPNALVDTLQNTEYNKQAEIAVRNAKICLMLPKTIALIASGLFTVYSAIKISK